MLSKTDDKAYHVQVLDRTFQILDILAGEGPDLGVTEVANRLGLHKSTAHRLIMVLESRLFLERDMNGKCRLGPRVMQLGLAVLAQLDLPQVARPHLRRLVRETGETAHVGVLRNGEIISIVNVQSTQALRSPSTVGSRTPAHCTALGKSILAFSPPEVAASLLRKRTFKSYTPNTISTAARLREELDRTRRRGYSCDNEEWEKGLRCLSAPVWDNTSEVVGAVGIAGPIFRITQSRIPALSSAIVAAAARISASLGYAANAASRSARA
jgi:DNA-binding IclR family transcriptional regulator